MYINKIWEVKGNEDISMVYHEIEVLRDQYEGYRFKIVEMKNNGVLTAIQMEVY